MKINVKSYGNFEKTTKTFSKAKMKKDPVDFSQYGEEGVQALRIATPKDSGLTSESWHYKIERNSEGNYIDIIFTNDNVVDTGTYTVNVALLIQNGHATRGGHHRKGAGWVPGRDYINPAIQPVFEKMADEIVRRYKS